MPTAGGDQNHQKPLDDHVTSIAEKTDTETLRELRAEAHRTVDKQLALLEGVTRTATQLLRVNLAIVGVFVAIVPIIDLQIVGDSRYIEIGIAALVVSTVLAAITGATTESDVGIGDENLRNILSAPISTAETEVLLLQNYCNRLQFLQTTNRRAIPPLKFAVFCAVTAVMLFAVGIYETVRGELPSVGILGIALGLLVIGWRLELYETGRHS